MEQDVHDWFHELSWENSARRTGQTKEKLGSAAKGCYDQSSPAAQDLSKRH